MIVRNRKILLFRLYYSLFFCGVQLVLPVCVLVLIHIRKYFITHNHEIAWDINIE